MNPELTGVFEDKVYGLAFYVPVSGFRCRCCGQPYGDTEYPNGAMIDIHFPPVGAMFHYSPTPPTEAEVDEWVRTGNNAALEKRRVIS